ncbi:hypothetical protein PHMEG_00023517 [Phytophthora megakarya]|uniref:Reverse transcriptase n=1 Tax=Phytophthora megakarya TaxID=4795 RepID=A0A225VGW4_9STRA|nr:hypothetical protein PHMEG_00023517 [Phytophthora megakarya]
MEHSAGSEVVLGTDFMIPAGICLDLFHATAKLPDEGMILLVKAQNFDDDIPDGMRVPGGPNDNLQIAAGEWADFRLQRNKPSLRTHDVWVLIAYAGSRDETLFQWECELCDKWLASQPSIVDRRPYTMPTSILQRSEVSSSKSDEDVDTDDEWIMTPNIADPRGCVDQWSIDGGSPNLVCATSAQYVLPEAESPNDFSVTGAIDDDLKIYPRCLSVYANGGLTDRGDTANAQETSATTPCQNEKTPEESLVDLERTFVCVMHVLSTEGRNEASDDDYDEHEANYISLERYAQELAFLPDVTEPSVTVLDYEGSNVKNPALGEEQQQRLVEMVKSHESIMISSGNALLPPAYGVVCDIDVNNHDPIKQRARRIPLRYLQKLYVLLKGLLKAGLIVLSDSPWASPIVIVLKKSGQDIRLCIDYNTLCHALTTC